MKKLLLIALLLVGLGWPGVGEAAIAFVSSISGGSGVGGDSFTTGSLDTTGANFIACGFAQSDTAAIATVTDSLSNTWLTTTVYDGTGIKTTVVYAVNATVGAAQTFTFTGTDILASGGCLAFSGVATSSAFDVENGATATAVTTLATGSVAVASGAVAIAVLCPNTGTSVSIDNSFTIQETESQVASQHYSSQVAYKLNPGTVNPAWSWTSNATVATGIYSFLQATVSTVTPQGLGWIPMVTQ